jgi:hypothetical protein
MIDHYEHTHLVGLVLPKMHRSNDQAYGTYYREGPKHISELKISIEQHRSQYRNSKLPLFLQPNERKAK